MEREELGFEMKEKRGDINFKLESISRVLHLN